MDSGLRDTVVLVTGGTRGIGLATARAYAAEGAKVAVSYRTDRAAAAAAAAGLGPADRAMAVRYALEEPDGPAAAVRRVSERWGPVGVLVANAVRRGARRRPGTRCEDVPGGDWEPVLWDNLAGTLRTVRAVLPDMRRTGWGRIVLVSSHVAADGAPGQEFYAAGKEALHGFARSLAWDVAGDGIRVNVVCPGLTATAGVIADLPPAVREHEAGRTPGHRLTTPEEVAAAVVFLGSAANGHINGQTLTVAGGR